MDEIFTLCAQFMTGEDLKYAPLLSNIGKSFETENNIQFIRSLDICLQSTIGQQYFYRYLKQNFCDETVIFLQLLNKFKSQTNTIQMYMIARDITKTSIEPNSNFAINVSYGCRNNILQCMKEFQQIFEAKQPLSINGDFFTEAEYEIYLLLLNNHWTKFVHTIKMLHAKSF
eukprot:10139_1